MTAPIVVSSLFSLTLLLDGSGPLLRVGQPVPVADQELVTVIGQLGDFDYATRNAASSLIRRAPIEQAQRALVAAVRDHDDGYVRFRALVLLVGFGGSPAREAVIDVLDDPNDRLRAVAYGYFEHEPDPAMSGFLIAALDTETSEFVRPALIRALAAHDDDVEVRDRLLADIDRGVDFFRGAVIEALGDHGARYAVEPLIRIASSQGPLRDDAVLALARIGDGSALGAVAALQGEDRDLEPMLSAAAVALGAEPSGHLQFVSDSLRFAAAAGNELDLVRSAAAGLGALASTGNVGAARVLFDVAVEAEPAARDAIALVLGTVAMRNPTIVLDHLQTRADLSASTLVLRDSFDILDEDLEEERFFMAARSAFWVASEGSDARAVTDELIKALEF